MQQSVLMTGVTGLLGRYLVRNLLCDETPLAVVARSNDKASAQDRVGELIASLEAEVGRELPRPKVFDGDLNQPGLGLDEAERQYIREHCDRLLHNAASLQFFATDPEGEPFRTNVGGTRNVLDLCEETGLRDLHHVSTAYVCGERPGPILESDLDCGQSFRNDYERAKFESEQLVRNSGLFDSLTVYRPAVIAGDSQTGFTSTYHGLFSYYKFIAVVARSVEPDENGRRHVPVRVSISGEERRNIVPVDWVAEAMTRIFTSEDAHGETYHLAPQEPVTTAEMISACLDYYSVDGVEFIGRDNEVPDPNLFEQALADNTAMYEAYETTDPLFDTSNTRTALPDLPCPQIDRDMLNRFIEFGESDRWGKGPARKKQKSPTVRV